MTRTCAYIAIPNDRGHTAASQKSRSTPTTPSAGPRFTRGGAGLEEVIDLFLAGILTLDAVAAEFGLSRDEVEDALRATARAAD